MSRPEASRNVRRTNAPALELLEDRMVLTTFFVDTAADVVDAADGVTSLREALAQANAADGQDTIEFLLGAGSETITLDAGLGELGITDVVSIDGTNAADDPDDSDDGDGNGRFGSGTAVTVAGGGATRLFSVVGATETGETVTLRNMTLTGGRADGAGLAGSGGALLVAAGQTVTLRSMVVQGNAATSDGAAFGGGAIHNSGTLNVFGSSISDNDAFSGGGDGGNGGAIVNAAGATLVVEDTTLAGNDAVRAGGAVKNLGTATFNNATVSGNGAGVNGGGVHVSGGGSVATAGGGFAGNTAAVSGGAFWVGADASLVTAGGSIVGNSAAGVAGQGGGGVYNLGSLTMTTTLFSGNDATAGSGGAFLNTAGATADLSGLTILDSSAAVSGGAIENAGTLNYSADLGNATPANRVRIGGATAGNGGIFHQAATAGQGDAPVATFTNVDVFNGTATGAGGQGGGLWIGAGTAVSYTGGLIQGNAADVGGAIYLDNGPATTVAAGDTLFIRGSSFEGNSAVGGGAEAGSGNGGAIASLAVAGGTAPTVSIDSSTIGNNNAAGRGGNLYLESGTFDLRSVTVAEGAAGQGSEDGANLTVAGAAVTLTNTVVADADAGLDVVGTVTSGGYNWIESADAGFAAGASDTVGGDPGLGQRAFVAGLEVYLPQSGSGLIDQGIDAAGIGQDQLGNVRPLDEAPANAVGGDGSDIGAIEIDVVDTGAPTAGIGAVTPDPRSTPVDQVVVTFSEAVTGLDVGDFTLTRDGVALSLATATLTDDGSGAVYTLGNLAALTAGDGDYVLTLAAAGSGVADGDGNDFAVDASEAFRVATDQTAPTADLIDVDPDPRNDGVDFVTVDFDEAVTGVDVDDFSLTRDGIDVPLTGVTLSGTGNSVTLAGLDPLTTPVGSYVLTLNAAGSGIQDGAGNALAVDASDAFVVQADQAAPNADVIDVTPDPRENGVDAITVVFDEAVTGVDLDDLALTRDGINVPLTGVTVTAGDDGTTYVVDGLGALTAAPGEYVFAVVAQGTDIADADGNTLGADASDLFVVTGDVTSPVADFGDVTPDPRDGGVDAVTVSFGEPVTGLDVGDFALTRDGQALALTGVTLTANADRTSFELSGLQALTDPAGDYVLTLNAAGSGIRDDAGNALAADASDAFAVNDTSTDTTPPVATVTIPRTDPTDGVDAITIDFGEPVTGLDAGDFRLTRNGVSVPLTGADLVANADGSSYRLTNLGGLTDQPGVYVLRLTAGTAGVADTAGNALATNIRETFTVQEGQTPDVTGPVGSIDDVDAGDDGVDAITVRFDEPVTGLDVGDFTLTRDGQDVPLDSARLTDAGDGTVFELTGLADLTRTPGTYVLRLTAAGSGVTDGAGNALTLDAAESFVVADDGDPGTQIDSDATLGRFRDGQWQFDSDLDGVIDQTVTFDDAPPGSQVLTADYNNDGRLDLVQFNAGLWFIDTTGDGVADTTFLFGGAGDKAFLADIDGDGLTDVIAFDTSGAVSTWEIDLSSVGGLDRAVDRTVEYGIPGDMPFVGDWDGDGAADLGLFRNGIASGSGVPFMQFFIDTDQSGGSADDEVWFGLPGDMVAVGDFDGDGTIDPGLARYNEAGVDDSGPLLQFFFDVARDGGGAEAEVWLTDAQADDLALFAPLPVTTTPATVAGAATALRGADLSGTTTAGGVENAALADAALTNSDPLAF